MQSIDGLDIRFLKVAAEGNVIPPHSFVGIHLSCRSRGSGA